MCLLPLVIHYVCVIMLYFDAIFQLSVWVWVSFLMFCPSHHDQLHSASPLNDIALARCHLCQGTSSVQPEHSALQSIVDLYM